MQSSWMKPASRMVKPRAQVQDGAEAEAMRENEEFARDQGKLDAQKKAQDDKIGALLGGKWFVTEWTDPILHHPVLNWQMTVSRFYPEIGVAVDIFPQIGVNEKEGIDLKRLLFKKYEATYGDKKIKVKYGALSYADPLANLLPQLEA